MKAAIFIVTILSLSMASCVMDKDNSEDTKKTIKNFVKEYFHILNLNPDFILDEEAEYYEIDSVTIIPFVVENYENPQPYFERVSKDEFTELSIKNNDTSFNNSVIYTFDGVAPATAIKEINLYTNTNYNNEFKKYSLLNDIIEVTYYTAADYINNGYSFYANNSQPEYTTNIEDFKKTLTLTDFNKYQYPLIALDYIKLKLTTPPSTNGIYSFSIEFEDLNGKILRKDLKAIKLKGK